MDNDAYVQQSLCFTRKFLTHSEIFHETLAMCKMWLDFLVSWLNLALPAQSAKAGIYAVRIDGMLLCRWWEATDDGRYEPWTSADVTALLPSLGQEGGYVPIDNCYPQSTSEIIFE